MGIFFNTQDIDTFNGVKDFKDVKDSKGFMAFKGSEVRHDHSSPELGEVAEGRRGLSKKPRATTLLPVVFVLADSRLPTPCG
jgi:hypothetical protein